MDYQKIYNQLIQKRLTDSLSKKDCYCESHHIIPRSEGGSDDDDNKVNLTAREHYIAHLLLAKIYNDYKMYAAITYMQTGRHKDRKFKFNNRLYGKIKEEFGRKQKGKKLSEEAKRKISEANKGCIPWNKGIPFLKGEKNPMYGKHHSEETKQKLRMPKTEIVKQHMRENHYDCRGEKNPMFGKDFQQFMTPEAIQRRKQKCSQSRKGKTTITNGVIQKMWDKNMALPDDWTYYKRKKPAN